MSPLMSLCETPYTGPKPTAKEAAAKIRKATMKACAKAGCARCALALAGTPPPSLAEEQAHIYGGPLEEKQYAAEERAEREARNSPFNRSRFS